MRLLHILFILILLPLQAWTQETPADLEEGAFFIFKEDGTLLQENEFRVEQKVFRKKYYDLNDEQIKISEMRFFQNAEGYYGVYKRGEVMEREEGGAIQLFSKIRTSTVGGERSYTVRSKYFCYSKDFEPLEPLKLKNLEKSFGFENGNYAKKDKNVYKYFSSAKKKSRNQWIIGGAGIGVFLVNGAIFNSVSENEDKRGLAITTLAIGVGALATTVIALFTIKPEKDMKRAINEYNRIY